MTEQKPLTVAECETMVEMLSWAMNGTEHGVMTIDSWKKKCVALKEFLQVRGYRPHGQWTTL